MGFSPSMNIHTTANNVRTSDVLMPAVTMNLLESFGSSARTTKPMSFFFFTSFASFFIARVGGIETRQDASNARISVENDPEMTKNLRKIDFCMIVFDVKKSFDFFCEMKTTKTKTLET
jgi:hypothetical protein